MDKFLLMKVMHANNETQSDLAAAMGLSRGQLNNKINCRRRQEFTHAEMVFIRKRYNMNDSDFLSCFFAQNVS